MSFLTSHQGILVGDDPSGHCGRMRANAPDSPAIRFAEPENHVSDPGTARPLRWRSATTTVDQVETMPASDSCMTAEIAAAITPN